MSDASGGSAGRAPGYSAGSSSGTPPPPPTKRLGPCGHALLPLSVHASRSRDSRSRAHRVPEERPWELVGFNAMAAPVNGVGWLYGPGRGPSPLPGQLPGQRPLALCSLTAPSGRLLPGDLFCAALGRGAHSCGQRVPTIHAQTAQAVAVTSNHHRCNSRVWKGYRIRGKHFLRGGGPGANRPSPHKEAMGETRARLRSPSLTLGSGGDIKIHSYLRSRKHPGQWDRNHILWLPRERYREGLQRRVCDSPAR